MSKFDKRKPLLATINQDKAELVAEANAATQVVEEIDGAPAEVVEGEVTQSEVTEDAVKQTESTETTEEKVQEAVEPTVTEAKVEEPTSAPTELEAKLNAVVEADSDMANLNGDSPVNLNELAASGELGAMVVEEAIAIAEESEPMALRIFKSDVKAYFAAFAPGQPHFDTSAAGKKQLRFAKLLTTAPERLGDHFKEGFTWLLAEIHNNQTAKGAMHDDYIFRFYNEKSVIKTGEEYVNATRVLSFLKMVANPATRAAMLKQCDIQVVLKAFSSDQSKRRIQNFFQQ